MTDDRIFQAVETGIPGNITAANSVENASGAGKFASVGGVQIDAPHGQTVTSVPVFNCPPASALIDAETLAKAGLPSLLSQNLAKAATQANEELGLRVGINNIVEVKQVSGGDIVKACLAVASPNGATGRQR